MFLGILSTASPMIIKSVIMALTAILFSTKSSIVKSFVNSSISSMASKISLRYNLKSLFILMLLLAEFGLLTLFL